MNIKGLSKVTPCGKSFLNAMFFVIFDIQEF